MRKADGAARWSFGVLAAAALTVNAHAQDPRLAQRLDAPTRAAVQAIIDSARTAKLPTQPLTAKALEGAGKGADGPRIVTAVRSLAIEMNTARTALGSSSSADEIEAGANALHAGLPPGELSRLRTARRNRRLTLPLAVACDLVARQVPALVASDIVVKLTKAGVRDSDFTSFQRNVRMDIDSGADPSTAATTRARGILLHAAGGPAATHPS